MAVARVCLVTKRPHATSDRAVAAVTDRLTAAGAEVLRVRRATDGDAVVKALYPAAHERYTTAPTAESTWDALRKRFDGKRFTTVFGEPYSPDLVVPGAVAAARFGLSEPELTAVWEEGRPPIARETLVSRYGATAAEVLTDGGSHYAWFRGPWPVGIQRIAPGLMAFALRHERLGDRPLIVLNGHVPGLTELFGEGTAIIGVGLDGLSVAELRHRVVGDDNRPERCAPGTIRRDAADGTFPLDPGPPVDSRRNVVHCSDGLLAGERESRALLGPEPGALTEQLAAAGLTRDEIETIVLRDPLVAAGGVEQPLTDATSGMDLSGAVRTITHFFPPVFGAANGFASGLSLATFVRALSETDTDDVAPEVRATTAIAPPAAHEQAGIAAMDAVGFVVPAGGTGGRFGGYGLPETHPDRQKALVPVFEVDGKPVSALDIRMANARHWRAATGARLPVAVMASPTSHDALAVWARKNNAELYDQHGVYRLRAGTERWFDRIAREPDGTPSLKPPGHLGALTCLALSGILDRWAADGIEYLAVANGDDVGFRVDPRIVGMLAADPGLDAVVAGVRWRPADSGGAICEVWTGDGWRVGVTESGQDRFAEPLFSTNQFVVRVAAVRRVFGRPGDVATAVQRFVDRQPFHVERKKVGDADALQLQQRINVVFSHLRMAAVRLSRDEPLETRGSYAGLKRQDDVPFGQWLLDKRADDLLF